MKKALAWIAELLLWLVDFFLIFLLVMAASLAIMREAKADERLPVAIVWVDADSYLCVRKTPDGELATRLQPHEDVVLLEIFENWAYVIRAQDYGKTDMTGTPLGWVNMDYLIIYSTKERMPTAATVSIPTTTEYLLPFDYIRNGGKNQ